MLLEDIVIFLTGARPKRECWRVEGVLCNPLATERSLDPLHWTAWELIKGRAPAQCRCQVATITALLTGVNAEGQLVSFTDDEESPPFNVEAFNAETEVRERASNAVFLEVETENPVFLAGNFLTSVPTHTPTTYRVVVNALLEALDQSPDFQRNIAYSERVALRNDDGELSPDSPVIEMKTAACHMKPCPGQLLPVELPDGGKCILGVLRLDRALALTDYEATLFLVDSVKELAAESLLLRSTTEGGLIRDGGSTVEIAKVKSVLENS